MGGYLARVVGAKYLFAVGVGGTAALTLLNPVAARTSTELLIAVRILEGVLEGVTFPTSHYLLGNWAPKNERSVLVAFPLSGKIVSFRFTSIHLNFLHRSNDWNGFGSPIN